MNRIEEVWDKSTDKEREEFLKKLDKRYKFERICRSLSKSDDCFAKRLLEKARE